MSPGSAPRAPPTPSPTASTRWSTSTGPWSPRRSPTPTCTPRRPASPSPASTCPARRTLADALDLVRAHAAAHPGRPGAPRPRLGRQRAGPSSGPPSRAELDEATGGRPLYLTRIDVHSAVVTTALLDLVPGVTGRTGYHPDAPLTARRPPRRARRRPRRRHRRGSAPTPSAPRSPTPPRSASARVHECARPRHLRRGRLHRRCWRSPPSGAGPAGLRLLGRAGRDAKDARRIRELGAIGAAGDLFVDGSLGSHTACLHEPVRRRRRTPAPPTSTPTPSPPMSPPAPRPGLQAGFHAIGDAAVTAVVEGVRAAAETARPRPRPGRPAPRRARRDAHPRDHRRLRRARPHRLRPARLRRGLGRRGRHVRPAARRRAGPHAQPVRGPAARRGARSPSAPTAR